MGEINNILFLLLRFIFYILIIFMYDQIKKYLINSIKRIDK